MSALRAGVHRTGRPALGQVAEHQLLGVGAALGLEVAADIGADDLDLLRSSPWKAARRNGPGARPGRRRTGRGGRLRSSRRLRPVRAAGAIRLLIVVTVTTATRERRGPVASGPPITLVGVGEQQGVGPGRRAEVDHRREGVVVDHHRSAAPTAWASVSATTATTGST